MAEFELVSEYKAAGDQPKAIEELVTGISDGQQFQTLLGVTGSGKTFTMANAIEQLGGAWTDLVRSRTYVVGGLSALDEASARLKANLAGTDSAAALMGVPILGRPEVVVEIEATAVLER